MHPTKTAKPITAFPMVLQIRTSPLLFEFPNDSTKSNLPTHPQFRELYRDLRTPASFRQHFPQPLFWFQSFQLTLYPSTLSIIIPILSGLTPIGTHSDFR
jgi:hypothetical protein